MRAAVFGALLIFWVCPPAQGNILCFLDAPQDDPAVRKAVWERSDAEQLNADYDKILKRYFRPLRSAQAPMVFGRGLRKLPAAHVLPVFMPQMIALDGGRSLTMPDKSHSEIYAVGDLGYIELYFYQDGQELETAALYFRPDGNFVPLRSSSDVPKRIEWEKKKWALIKDWLKVQWAKNSKSARVLS